MLKNYPVRCWNRIIQILLNSIFPRLTYPLSFRYFRYFWIIYTTIADSCWLQWILDYSQPTPRPKNIYLLAFLVTGQFLKLHVWDIWDVLSKANCGWTTLYNTDEKQKGSM